MRRTYLLLILLMLLMPALVSAQKKYAFVENRGQWPSEVAFSSDLENGKLFLTSEGFTYHFFDLSAIRAAHHEGKLFQPEDIRIRGHVYRMQFEHASLQAAAMGQEKLPTRYNYFLGNDPAHWAGDCASFDRVIIHDLYPQIDLHYYQRDFFLKYDLILHPGSDANLIQMKYDGVQSIEIENGRLHIRTSVNEIYEQKPIAWQIIEGNKKMVRCDYQLSGTSVSFDFPDGYDNRFELIIDPELVFSTYSGSESDNFGYTATYDEQGYLYSGSSAFGQLYPTTLGAYQTTHQGGDSVIEEGIDMALSKYDISGTFMVWSTFLGGSGDDLPHSIITNTNHELFVYGTTGSANYPITSGAFDNTFAGGSVVSPTGTGANFPNGTDIVLSHLNAAGSIMLGSTFVGGSGNDGVCVSAFLKRNYADEFRGEISLDDNGNVLIASSSLSTNFPTINAFQNNAGGALDAVLFKISPNMQNMFWSTYLGGNLDDSGFSISTNSSGDIYLCGGTRSENFPVGSGGIQPTFGGGNFADGYIVRFTADGQTMLNGTYWGIDEYDQLYFLEIDNEDNVYVFGQTNADGNERIINASYGTANSGNLISKFAPELDEVIWSTVFGTGSGTPTISPSAFLVDCANRVYVSGWGATAGALNPGGYLTSMVDMEVSSNAFDSASTGGDFYLAVFDENMTSLQYATFYGGATSSEHVDGGTSRFDRKGIIYQSVCAGCGGNDDFPIYPADAWSPTNNTTVGCNNGVFKFDYDLPLTIAALTVPGQGCTNQPYAFSNLSSVADEYQWSFGDNTFSSEFEPSHMYSEPGEYTVRLIASDPGCGTSDTAFVTVNIEMPQFTALENQVVCPGDSALIGPENAPDDHSYVWAPDDFLSSTNEANPEFTAGSSMDYIVLDIYDACVDTFAVSVDVPTLSLTLPADTVLCDDELLVLTASYSPADASIIWSEFADLSVALNDGPTDADISVTPITPETYYAGIVSQGCTLTDEVHVNLVSFQTVIQGDFTVCAGDTIALSVLDPNPDFQYSWVPEELVISGQNTPSILAVISANTTFTVFSETNVNCTASDEVEISVSPLSSLAINAWATPDVITQGQNVQLQASPDGYSYQWTPDLWLSDDQAQNPVASPEETITYTVSVFDDECFVQRSVTVEVVDFVCGPPSIYVPNAFTPNSDNKNEKLYVRANNITSLYFVIYDRWGEKVFETTQIEKGWDGKFEGRELDPDVYVYYLEATCAGGQEYFEEGNISLIR